MLVARARRPESGAAPRVGRVSPVAPAPRYAPEHAFPPYAFVSPNWPHPMKDPAGHMYGRAEPPPVPLAAEWADRAEYRHGLDLFNHGYYWEAHEAWETLWNAAGRAGIAAEFLKGLIKLAAAGVKVRQNMPRGVRIHGERGEAHFRAVREAAGGPVYARMDLDALMAFARRIADGAERLAGDARRPVEVVFDTPLTLIPPCDR